MIRRAFLALGLALSLSLPAAAQDQPKLVLEIDAAVGKGTVVIGLRPDIAPLHVARIMTLANNGEYDNVAFHRVITGFMAQTGDITYAKRGAYSAQLAGQGGSSLPNLPAEFSDVPFAPGVVGMARATSPDSANSQFFIMTERHPSLDGQYTVIGEVIEGLEMVRALRTGPPQLNGMVRTPDFIESARIE
ncbi:cyclophilin family peptidyl-prolyl cis-trans isomerase [Rubricella aquisinus]|uniref:Peptidyl-prolyl cis-trans isomerase n=1 Tax=Rubricella aquisinus TaxID=2028108 RepID=A0A840WUE0_9RHOB|nr:peptidylprolyl isomerase [Rubricella aquisinus]MBB5514830.1 cyclophilin family peptidyl-prolyl cis-trans isomerase [Rubricella aquisinus]